MPGYLDVRKCTPLPDPGRSRETYPAQAETKTNGSE